MLEKTLQLSADEVVIDLEDSVAADAKDDARDRVVGFLAGGHQQAALIAVRINALAGAWGTRRRGARAPLRHEDRLVGRAEG